MKKFVYDSEYNRCARDEFDGYASCCLGNRQPGRYVIDEMSYQYVDHIASIPNCEEFLYYIRISFVEGIIFKRQLKTVYPNGCSDINSFKEYLHKKLNGYDFKFLPSDKNQYLLLKFSNVSKAKDSILQNAKNTYMDFYNRNYPIIEHIMSKIGFNDKYAYSHKDHHLGYRIRERLGNYYSSDNSFEKSCDLCITKNDIDGYYYSHFGMNQLPNLDDICKLGVSIAKFIDEKDYNIEQVALLDEVTTLKYNDGTPMKFKFKCDFRIDIVSCKLTLSLKPVVQKQELGLNNWN